MAKKPLTFKSEDDFRAFKEDIAEARAEEAKKTKVIHIAGLEPAKKTSPEQKVVKAGQSVHEALESLRKAIIENWDYLRLDFIDSKAEFDFLASAPDYITELEPFLIILVEKNSDFTIVDFYHQCFTDDWEIKEDCPYLDIIERAKADKAAFEAAKTSRFDLLQLFAEDENKSTTAKAKKTKITAKPTNEIGLPTDKLSFALFGYNKQLTPNKQYRIDTLGDSESPVLILVDYDGIAELDFETTKELDYYDEFVASAAASLRATQPNGVFSESKLCDLMALGNSKRNRENVRMSMEKQRLTIIKINNQLESEKSNYPPFKYDGAVLPFERVETTINGKPTKAIHLLEEPPMTRFARERKQFATVKREVIAVPTISNSRRNVGLKMYLIRRKAQTDNNGTKAQAEKTVIENGKEKKIKAEVLQSKILKATLLSEFKVKANHKKEFIETVKKILTHYMKMDYIFSFDEQPDSFVLNVYPPKGIRANAAKGKKS